MSDTPKPDAPPEAKKPAKISILAFDEMLKNGTPHRSFDIVTEADKEPFISLTGKPRRSIYDGKTFIITDGGTSSIVGFPNKRLVDMV